MAQLFWYFILYSFLGFLLEVLFARLIGSPKRDRKCLYLLPLCPVYGLGAVLILLLPPFIRGQPLLLLPCAALVATGAEYLMGLFYERVAKVSFWDYRALPLNVGGKVCLLFTGLWGLLSLGLIYGVHPPLSTLVAAIPPVLTLPVFLLFAADVVFTLSLLRRTRTTQALQWYRPPKALQR